MELTFNEVKINASKEINELIWENLSEKLKGLTNIKKHERNLYKIINFHISPVFNDIIESNKIKLEKDLLEINKEDISIEDKQYKMNQKINSLLSMWKKTILSAKMVIVTAEGGKYLKSILTDTTKINYQKRDKIIETREKYKKKYNLD